MERTITSDQFPLGSLLPDFTLPGTDGQQYKKDFFSDAPLSLVVFTCNHCPYVKGSEAELLSLIAEFQKQGLKAVLISANDAKQYPDDSFEMMQRKSVELPLPCPYLYDQAQIVAKAFDAQCTPEVYLFDASQRLAYHGAINDSPRDASKVSQHYLRQAMAQLLAGGVPSENFIHPIGCSIKWTI